MLNSTLGHSYVFQRRVDVSMGGVRAEWLTLPTSDYEVPVRIPLEADFRSLL